MLLVRFAGRTCHLVWAGHGLSTRRDFYSVGFTLYPLYSTRTLVCGRRATFLYEIEIILSLPVGGKML